MERSRIHLIIKASERRLIVSAFCKEDRGALLIVRESTVSEPTWTMAM